MTLEIIAGVAAVVVMTYAGAVLARPRSIPYWNSLAVPVQFFLSSAAMSVAAVLSLEVIHDRPISRGQMVLLGALTAGLLAAVAVHLSTHRDAPGKQESLDSLLRGAHRRVFVGMVMIAGTAVPALLAFIGAGVADARDAISVISFALLVPGRFPATADHPQGRDLSAGPPR